jgi:hypothetical protein
MILGCIQKNICPLCHEIYSTAESPHCPRIFPCGHTFCQECINTMFRLAQTKKKGVNNQSTIVCPICRVEHKSLKAVEEIPKNYALIPENMKPQKPSLSEFLSILANHRSDGMVTNSCTPSCMEICESSYSAGSTSSQQVCPTNDNVIVSGGNVHEASCESPDMINDEMSRIQKKRKKYYLNDTTVNTLPADINMCTVHFKSLDLFDEHCQQLYCMECFIKEHRGNISNELQCRPVLNFVYIFYI